MTEATARLWPSPDQLKRYLDSWATYAAEQEKRAEAAERQLHEVQQMAERTERTLRNQNLSATAPLQARIYELEDDVSKARAQVTELTTNEAMYRRTLVQMLELSPNTGSSTASLLNELTQLIDEFKRQFRGSL